MKTVKVQRFLDRVGGNVLANVLAPFKSRERDGSSKNRSPKNILVINLWGMGDAVLTLPLIAEIKRRFPSAQLDVLATKRVDKVYAGVNYINKILLLEDRKTFRYRRKYDLVFDTEHYLNSSALAAFYLGKETIGYAHGQRAKLYTHTVEYNDAQHIVATYFDLLRVLFPEVKNPEKLVRLPYSDEDKKSVTGLLRNNDIREDDFVVGFCVSAAESAPSRRWPKEKFAALADELVENYQARIVFVSGPNDFAENQAVFELMKHNSRALNPAKEMNVKRTFALVEQCKLFISNDTGPMHVAAAQGVPTVGLFCPNTPVRYGPYGSGNISVYKPVLSGPCINVHKGVVPDCEGHNHMSTIELEDVLEAVENVLKRKG